MIRRSAALLLPLALLSTAPPAAAQRAAPRAEAVHAAVGAHRQAHESAVMEELRALLAIPNIATELPDIRRNAELLVTMLERRSVRARLLELDGRPPAVFGELRTPGATRTVVLYAHYDGQPVDPAEWATPPWEPTLYTGRLQDGASRVPWAEAPAPIPDDWRIYARAASDDKGPIVNADNNQHAADENLRIGNFWDGVTVYAGLIARLGAEWAAVERGR